MQCELTGAALISRRYVHVSLASDVGAAQNKPRIMLAPSFGASYKKKAGCSLARCGHCTTLKPLIMQCELTGAALTSTARARLAR